MQALFVHGMGRSPLSGWPLTRRLEQAGVRTYAFSYFVALESAAQIRARLRARIAEVAAKGDYVLIGHSLGGVLLRAALADAPAGLRPPHRLFLLGSPVVPARIAQALGRHPIFRALTRDCGAMLGSPERMAAVPGGTVPTTAVAGTRGMAWSRRCFGKTPNDGIVAVPETSAPWIEEYHQVPVIHTFLPSSRLVAAIVGGRIADLIA